MGVRFPLPAQFSKNRLHGGFLFVGMQHGCFINPVKYDTIDYMLEKRLEKTETAPSLDRKVQKQLQRLNENIEKELSFKRSFVLSILKGVGYTIGATIVASILLAILAKTVDAVPVLDAILSSLQAT